MTTEEFESAIGELSQLLRRLHDEQVDADQIRELFTREVKYLSGKLSAPRRVPLYDFAAKLLDEAGLGFR